ncbi:hypothetical protein WA158_001274 [Blastocystis sp. Blastoise]
MEIEKNLNDEVSAKNEKDVQGFPWVEKYRPTEFEEIVSHDDILSTINKLIENKKLPHLLFHGPPGTGKTTTILACARKMYGSNYKSMTLELNASDDRGIDVVRDQIKNFAGTQKLFSSGVKLIILDEADNMTNVAQFALRRIIEKYSQNTRFCLICNYVSNIIPALQKDGINALLELCEGDMRKVINLLQATHMAFPIVNQENVYLCSGSPSPVIIQSIMDTLLQSSFNEAMKKISEIKESHQFALQDIVPLISKKVQQLELPPQVQIYLYKQLADLEYRLASSCQESIQLGSLIIDSNSSSINSSPKKSAWNTAYHICVLSYLFGLKKNKRYVGLLSIFSSMFMIAIYIVLTFTVGSCPLSLYTQSHTYLPCSTNYQCQTVYYIDQDKVEEVILPETGTEYKYCDLQAGGYCRYKNYDSICSSIFSTITLGGLETGNTPSRPLSLYTYSWYHLNLFHIFTNILLYIPLSISMESITSTLLSIPIHLCTSLSGSLLILTLYKYNTLVIGCSAIVYGFIGFICIFRIGGFIGGIILAFMYTTIEDYTNLKKDYEQYQMYWIPKVIVNFLHKTKWYFRSLGWLLFFIYFCGLISFHLVYIIYTY